MSSGMGVALVVYGSSTMGSTDLFDEFDERELVLAPVALELLCRRELGAAEFDGHLEAVGRHVVEVLHPVRHTVPLRSVRDPAVLPELLVAVCTIYR